MLYIKKRKEKRDNIDITCSDLYITRGDSGWLDLELTDAEGHSLVVSDGDTIKCQVRESEEADAQLIFDGRIETAESGIPVWHIYPEDTASLDVKEYVYDIEIDLVSGDVITFIPLSKFVLLPESTRKE